MNIIINSIRNIFFAAVVLIINIPVFWSSRGFVEFIKGIAKSIGLGV